MTTRIALVKYKQTTRIARRASAPRFLGGRHPPNKLDRLAQRYFLRSAYESSPAISRIEIASTAATVTADDLPQPGVIAAVAVAGCRAPVGALADQVEDRAAVTITLVNPLFGLALVGQPVAQAGVLDEKVEVARAGEHESCVAGAGDRGDELVDALAVVADVAQRTPHVALGAFLAALRYAPEVRRAISCMPSGVMA